jgi:Periplasmic binding protein
VTSPGSRSRRASTSPRRSTYRDINDQTRAFTKRFNERYKKNPPTVVQAGVYSSLIHYFKTLEALGGNPHDGRAVVAKMKEIPTDEAKAFFAFCRALDARGSVSAVLENFNSLMLDYGGDVPVLADVLKTIERMP